MYRQLVRLSFLATLFLTLTAHSLVAGAQAPAGATGGACYGNSTCDKGNTCDLTTMSCVAVNRALGTSGGACYGNGTCNDGLVCEPTQRRCSPTPGAMPPKPPGPPQPPKPPMPTQAKGAPKPPLPPTRPQELAVGSFAHHSGFLIGLGLGLGTVGCDGCNSEGGLAYNFSMGGFLNPEMALMFDLVGWYDSEGSSSVIATNSALALQYWGGPAWWLKGGLGWAQLTVEGNGFSGSIDGVGITGAAGYEVVQNAGFVVDLSVRLGVYSLDNDSLTDLAFLAGVNWY